MSGPRTLPARADAEAAVLGGILLRPDAIHVALDAALRPDDFYVPGNQAVFRAMLKLADAGQPIDVITLEEKLEGVGELPLAGGIEGLTKLSDSAHSSHNIRAHVQLVADAAHLRRVVLAAREIAEKGLGEIEDVKEFVDDAEKNFLESSSAGRKDSTYRSSKEVMFEVFENITSRRERDSSITGVSTGFYKLDEMTAGLQAGDLIIVAARPSMGKTALVLNIAQNAAVLAPKYNHIPEEERPPTTPVLLFSLEMGATQLVERMLCSEARVDFSRLRRGQLAETEFRSLIDAASRLSAAHLHIDDAAAPSLVQIRTRARRWREDKSIFPVDDDGKRGHGLIVVDYLQLCRGGGARYDSREREISEISRGFKALGRELGVPVIALSQLNRAVDSRPDHRPQLSDLRESGAIEQDADVIMFIFREEYYVGDAEPERKREVANKAEVIIGKQRNGPTGSVPLTFIKRYTRFENPARDDY